MIAFASDFDGTLSFPDRAERFSSEDLSAIREFQAGGGLFGVCTGRSLVGVRHLTDGYIDFDFYVLASGALVLDRALNVIHKVRMDPTVVGAVNELYGGRLDMVIHADNAVYTFGDPLPMQRGIRSMDDIADSDVYGFSIAAGSVENARRLCAELMARYGGELVAYENVSYVDAVPLGCSKGEALLMAKENLGVGCMAGMGDSFNDISMLERADVAFTFPASPAEVRRHADHLAGSVAEALGILGDEAVMKG